MSNNKAARIKISVYMIILLLLVNFLPFVFQVNQTQVYAENYSLHQLGGKTPKKWYDDMKASTGNGSTIKFVEESQLLVFVNETRAASSVNVIRFCSIGWQVRFVPHDGSTKFMTWINAQSIPNGDQKVNGMIYTPFVIPIAPSEDEEYKSIFEAIVDDMKGTSHAVSMDYLSTKFSQGVDIYFDAILSIKESGSTQPNAKMTTDRTVIPNKSAPKENRGEYYLTRDGKSLGSDCVTKANLPKQTDWDKEYGGIQDARWWSDKIGLFKDYFGKKAVINPKEVKLQKTVKYTCWSTTGERLDPTGAARIYGIYYLKPGETVPVTIKGPSFPGYKIYSSAFNYTGRGGADDFDVVKGDQALTRTINLTTEQENHYVYFYYEPIGDTGPTSGTIIFEPNQSADISGNRDNWVNKDISVKVTVEPSQEKVVMTSSESRSYEYYDSCYTTKRVCDTDCWTDEEGERHCDTDCWNECVGKDVSASASCGYKQTWKATKLYVTGQGKDAQGNTVSIGPFTISNGGTVTISKELKDVQLTAKVSEWTPQNDRTFDSDSPPDGHWTQSSPSKDTPKPTVDYQTTSGLYYLDKTAPKVDSVSPTSAGWTNSTVTVSVSASDNLSGFYRYDSYAQVTDESYYERTKNPSYFTQGELSQSKTLTLSQDGIYSIDVSLEDIAKNTMNKVTYGKYRIDKTSPYDAEFSWDYRDYIDENLTVSVVVGDNLSGVVETRYVLNNSPYDTSGMHSVSASTADGTEDYDSFTVQITQPGSWWIHVYQRDRAGNVTYTTSEEYKIVRLGTSSNTGGNTFTGQSDKFWISPLQMNHKIPRATRFDTLLQTYGLTEAEANYTTVHLTVPNWVDDEIEKKVNGKYAVTDGTTDIHTMEYYSEHNQGPQDYATPSTVLQWWKAYIAPYGTPVTLDKNGNRLRTQYEFKVQLEYDYYYPSKTHISTIKFDIIPETKVKTEIIKNEY